jgi:hypothetical protein
MSDTPRTDAQTYVWEKGRENPFVHKEFAQQLERELNEKNNEVERLKSELHQSAYLLATTGREDLARRVIEKSDDENSILNPNSRYVKELLK